MSKRARQKEKFVDLLRDYPIVSSVAEKLGVSKATYYRWRREDPWFAQNAEDALLSGKESVNDLAISGLIALIKNRNFGAIKYWLAHNHKDFSEKTLGKIKEEYPGLTPDQEAKLVELLSYEEELRNRNRNDGPT